MAALTSAALEQRAYRHPGSLGDILHPGADLVHHAGDFVTKDERSRVRVLVSEVHVEVAAAYPVVRHLNTHFVLTCDGLRYFFETNVL